jgi:hypothetical protein
MEFGTKIMNDSFGIIPTPENTNYIRDENFTRFVGWSETDPFSDTVLSGTQRFFSQDTVNIISAKVTELTMGVHERNIPIKVTDNVISHVMSNVYSNFRPPTGDIHSRYIIPTKEGPYSYIQEMIDRTIEIIVSDLKNSFGMRYNNESLSIWTTVYGDFNAHKLRQHAPIKVVNKRPDPMQFFQNY